MKDYVGKAGVRVGVVIWYQSQDVCVYVPIASVTDLVAKGKKSIRLKEVLEGTVPSVVVPSKKKRVFLDCDYTCLLDLEEGW